MATLTFNGSPVHTIGELPIIGRSCPPFTLTRVDLSEISIVDLEGQRVILNIFPSLDTTICAKGVRTFNAHASEVPNMVVLCVSQDLPFAQARFCKAEDIEDVVPVSTFRHAEFGNDFGVMMMDGPLRGLLARALVVLDENSIVVHTELVPELACEADYDGALDIIHNHHQPCLDDALLTSE